MLTKRSLFASLVAIGALAAPSSAQICDGRPGADAGSVLLGAGVGAADGVTEFGVGVTGLGERVYGGATVGSISYDDLSGSTTTVGASVGYQLPLGTSGRAQLCPYLGGALGFGPNDVNGSGIDASSRSVGAGLSWGFRATQSADLSLVPMVSAGFAYTSIKLTDGVDDFTDSDTYGQLGFGLGVVLGRQFAARPSVTIPLGLDDADPVLAITISLSVGSRRQD